LKSRTDTEATTRTTVLLLADPDRPDAVQAATQIEQTLEAGGISFLRSSTAADQPLPELSRSDVAVVIGGDGTMISQACRLVDTGVPMVGVNCGRLGFLAPFSPDSFAKHLSSVLGPDRVIEHRLMLEVCIEPADGSEGISRLAMNDGVIAAGEPYRMIRMATLINQQDGPPLAGDGLIVASPTGSTGHNASVGGPIVDPLVAALVVSPIAAQSLAFRPFVLDGDSTLEVVLEQVNEGTTLVLDGQRRVPLRARDRIRFTRYNTRMPFVACPDGPFWRILHDKLGWARPPVG
jgi:NAD+ kinase